LFCKYKNFSAEKVLGFVCSATVGLAYIALSRKGLTVGPPCCWPIGIEPYFPVLGSKYKGIVFPSVFEEDGSPLFLPIIYCLGTNTSPVSVA
jgi:hypothetical protein